MLATWSLLVIQFAFPLFVFFNYPLSLFQSQPILGIFGSEYRDYYNSCIEKNTIQAGEITQLTVALKEAETKLKDVDIYRESVEQREEILKNREKSLNNHQVDIDGREQRLEQQNFDFTKKLEEVSRNGGKAEQILANNEMLKNRVNDLERNLNEERISSKESLEKEREFSKKGLENERRTNERLLDRASGANQTVLLVAVIMIVVGLVFIGSIGFLYFKWLRGDFGGAARGINAPLQIKVVEEKPVALSQDNESLPPG